MAGKVLSMADTGREGVRAWNEKRVALIAWLRKLGGLYIGSLQVGNGAAKEVC